MVPRVYISGPITKGDRNHNFYQASVVEKQLMLAGCAPLNPMRSMLVPHAHDADLTHELWMQSDIPWVEVSDAILRLPGESKGGDQEVARAASLAIPIFYNVDDLLEWKREYELRHEGQRGESDIR